MNKLKGIIWKDKTVTITLTDTQLRAIRSAITWAEMLESAGELELFDYQKETFDLIKEIRV